MFSDFKKKKKKGLEESLFKYQLTCHSDLFPKCFFYDAKHGETVLPFVSVCVVHMSDILQDFALTKWRVLI